MGKKTRIVPVATSIIKIAKNDIQGNKVKIYTKKSLPGFFIDDDIIHPAVYSKSSTFSLACSACPTDDRRYVYICAHREDHNSVDMDPICFAYYLSTETPSPSGIVAFHGSFQGRTLHKSYSDNIISNILNGAEEAICNLDGVTNSFTEAMHFVAIKFKDEFD